MPGMDGTGPLGKGPLNGGQAGICRRQSGQSVGQPQSADTQGRGWGFGHRCQGAPGKGSGGDNRAGIGHRVNGNR